MSMPAPMAAAATSLGTIDPAPGDFEAMLQSVLEPAYRAAYHLCSNASDAAELLQEAALRAFRTRANRRPGVGFEAWFLAILAESYVSRSSSTAATPFRCTGVTADAEASAECERIRQALASLPLEDRVVTTMHFVDNLTYQDIALALNVPLQVVRDRLHRGRHQLGRMLADSPPLSPLSH